MAGKLKTPWADLVPPLSTAEFEVLKADIKEHGVIVPIDIDEDGNILDGHHRYKCDRNAPTRVIEGLTETEKEAYVLGANFKRRHWSASQRAELRERQKDVCHRLRKEKRYSQRKLAILLGVSQQTISMWLNATNTNNGNSCEPSLDNREKIPSDRHAEIYDRAEIGETQDQISADYGVRRQAISKIVSREKQKRDKQAQLEAKQEAARPLREEQPEWTLIQQDVMEGLGSVLDHHGPVRLIFADPPYNIGVDYGRGIDDERPDKDYLGWAREWLSLCVDALTDDGSMWVMIGDEYAAEYAVILKDLGLTIRSWVKWYETFGVNCAGNFNRTSRHIFYCIWDPDNYVFHPGPVTGDSARLTKYNDKRANPAGKIWDDVWQIPRVTGTCKERIPHFPTQLPLELLRAVVGCSSDPGDLVLDPFNGSGTTGAACIELGRRYIGIDASKKFIDLSHKRLKGMS